MGFGIGDFISDRVSDAAGAVSDVANVVVDNPVTQGVVSVVDDIENGIQELGGVLQDTANDVGGFVVDTAQTTGQAVQAGHNFALDHSGLYRAGRTLGEVVGDVVQFGNRNDAYNGAEALTNGVAFADMNPEEQADVIAHLAEMEANPTVDNIPFDPPAGQTKDDVVAIWNATLTSIQNGEGAP